jgi:hypothetical protein
MTPAAPGDAAGALKVKREVLSLCSWLSIQARRWWPGTAPPRRPTSVPWRVSTSRGMLCAW